MKYKNLLWYLFKNRNNLSLSVILERMRALPRFVSAVRRKEYQPNMRNLLLAGASMLYLVSPIDLIPDVIFPILGLADDFLIFGYGLDLLNAEIKKFMEWELQSKSKLKKIYIS